MLCTGPVEGESEARVATSSQNRSGTYCSAALSLLICGGDSFLGLPSKLDKCQRYWNTLSMNSGTKRFLGRFPICDSVKPHNGVRLVFHPKGLRPFIENWESVAARIIQRVHREIAANPSDETLKCFLEELLSYPAGAQPLARAGS
jgi:hypothetical protein